MSTDPFKIRDTQSPPQQSLLLTQSQLNKLILNSKSEQDEKEDEKARLEERKQRQEATKALSKLVMQRKEPGIELRKKQYAQDVKKAQLELERETMIEARRNYVLELAYKRLYGETDRVKYFQTAKNLSEMLKQRDTQLEAKAEMKDLFLQYDKQFIVGMIRDVDNYEKEERGKLEKVKKDKTKNAANWTKQLVEVQRTKEQAEWEHMRDGYIVREAAKNYAEEVKKSELKQKRKVEEYKQMLDRQRNEKLSLLGVYAKLDEADEKRVEIFNEAKSDMKIKHKEMKEGLDKQKEMKRQYVANNLRDESISIKLKEEAILQKAILQADAKSQEECIHKQAKREEALKSIQEFYEHEMEAKSRRELEGKRGSFKERRKILELVEDQQKAEDCKREAKRNSEKEAQHLQLHQMAKKRMDKYAEKMDDVKDYMNHMRSLDDEEEIFQKYAQLEIQDSESRGINTRPMRFAARPGIECGKGPLFKYRGHIRPKYYSAIAEGDELNHVKRDQKKPDTKLRLGFMLH